MQREDRQTEKMTDRLVRSKARPYLYYFILKEIGLLLLLLITDRFSQYPLGSTILLSSTDLCRALLGSTGLYHPLLGSTDLYWALPSFWALPTSAEPY